MKLFSRLLQSSRPILKRWLYPLIWIVSLIFLGLAFAKHWQEVRAMRIGAKGGAGLAIATGVTLLAHIWAGWVWGWILAVLEQPVNSIWAVQTYLKTNPGKYLPSNLFHLYGRTLVARSIGIPLAVASLSILLDTLLLAAAGLIVTLIGIPGQLWLLEGLSLGMILGMVHPWALNYLLAALARIRRRTEGAEPEFPRHRVQHYPLRPLLGEIGFVLLRGLGFVLTIAVLAPLQIQMLLPLLGVFSLAWLLGFVTPGAPGGLGIFELTVVTLLQHPRLLGGEADLSPAVILSGVALYRLVSILAEVLGAGLAWLDDKHPITRSAIARSWGLFNR